MKRNLVRKVLALLVIAGLLTVMSIPVTVSAATTDITIDGTSGGKIFDGVGMISGGGGNSRLLIDYPEPYRSQILDYLFKPNFGASMSVFKVEIGSDGNSTSGAEPSHMHTASDQNYTRGYEGWLISEAKKRNPGMIFDCLPWGAPGWVGNYWSTATQNYIINYIKGMQDTYGITFRTVGGKNESGYNSDWYISFKQALKAAGLSTKLTGSDDWMGNWAIATDMNKNAALRDAVDYIGFHTPHENKGGSNSGWPSVDAVLMRDTYGKPLWSSEDHYDGWSQGYASATEMASALNMNYILGKITCTMFWTLVAACYDNIPYNDIGLIKCNQPWSGYYNINAPLWAMAHTTQFIKPGWQYLDGGCKFFGADTTDKSGSVVCAKSTNDSDWSAVVDMSLATAAQTLNFSVKNLSTSTVHVWATKVTSKNSSDWFNKLTDITPASGAFTFTAEPGYVYSFTTTTGQGKGTVAGPSSTYSLPLPYSDDFESYDAGKLASYFSDMNGSFETYPAGGGRSGMVLRQMAPIAPMAWSGGYANKPYTIMGSSDWSDYTVSCDLLLESTSEAAELLGRVNGINAPNGYSLRVDDTGAWSVLQNSTALATGKLAAFGINQWHNLSLSFKGNSITAKIDNTTVAALTDTTYRSGYVGLAVTSYKCAQFDNFSIINNSTSTPTPTTSITSTTPTPTLTTSASPKPTQDNSGNLALGKLATSDSEESSKGNIASNANDGDNNTRWRAADNGLNHWWKIDLGAGNNLTGTEVMWERALKNYKYKIDVSSDNVNWTTSVDKTNNLSTDQTQRDNFTASNIRYVRITVTGLETDAWASIYEFRVYGKSGPAQLSPDVNHDGAVNMSDVIILATVFNSISGDGRYVAAYDLNGDGAINMTDIILIAAKFNTLV